MGNAVIVAGARSGVGKYAGQWAPITSEFLAGSVVREAVKRSNVDPAEIEDVIIGNLAAQHGNHGRLISLEAGIPITASGLTIDRQCGSGLQAIILAAQSIMVGAGDVFVAGGVEHMTSNPWQLEKPNTAYSRITPKFVTNRFTPDSFGNPSMVETAENLAQQYNLSRTEVDTYSAESHRRATEAINTGLFKTEIVPIQYIAKGKTLIVDKEEIPRPETTVEALTQLKPIFKKDGIVTAGNSCPFSDGAAAVVMMSEEKARTLGLKPIVRVKSFAVAGVHPQTMGIGPVPATQKALKRAGLQVKDLGVIELNEAFAAQVIPCMRELGLSPEKTNPNGGAIALGHPLGATGTILTIKLMNEMQRRGYELGLVTMCIGGGQGIAAVFEAC